MQTKSNSISLLFAGDFIPPESSENIFSYELQKILMEKDFSIVNLEAPLTTGIKRILKNGNSFKVSPGGIQHIIKGKFDAVALANNHIKDYGCQGVTDTIRTCEQNNILTVGAGVNLREASRALRVTIKGKKISILNFSEEEFNIATEIKGGANPLDLIDALNQLKLEKGISDFIIVIYHGGIEYHHLPMPGIVKLFKFLIEAGADCIVSHHTHRYSGLLYHQNKPILFGLGNFLSATISKSTEDWQIGILAKINIDHNNISVELIPTQMEIDFSTVRIVSETKKQMVINHINEISKILFSAKMLQEYWDADNENTQKKLINILKSNSHFEYRIRKYLPFMFNSGVSHYRLMNILNIIRCSSQRERLISIFEKRYNKFKD